MKVYEKPNAVIVSFETERIMDDEATLGESFSAVNQGVADLPVLP